MLKRLKLRKISWKITLLYALIFSAILILLNAGTLFGIRFYLIRQAGSQVENIGKTMTKHVSRPEEKSDLSDPELIRSNTPNAETYIRIVGTTGKTLGSSDGFPAVGPPAAAQAGRLQVFETDDRHLVIWNDRIAVGGKTSAYLQVAYDMRREYVFIKLLFIFMAAADSLGIVFSLLAGYLISKRILKPIDRMTKAAKEISIADLSRRIEVGHTDDELSRLAVTFNDMIGRLQQSFERQNRFVSDASHELRTPISIIQGYAGLIDRWGKDERSVLEESIAAIRNETENMTALIGRLLFLARGDSESIALQREEISLSALVEEVAYESRLIAPKRSISGETEGEISISADRKLVKQMLRALVDNSVKYTSAGGSVRIHAAKGQRGATVTVADDGIGIPEKDLPHLFERFYRVDKARSREEGGSGLGLSIVKWIVEAHRGTIGISSTPGKGTTVTISLPERA
jgi:heavy metal sensor kinase